MSYSLAPATATLIKQSAAQHVVICQSARMRSVFETAARAGQRGSKVLITGESGVGKEVVARHVHAASPRAAQPFVAVNCAGLAETLLESELFGHVKGSFTGAYRNKPGKLQLAHGGTIFFDEVGEMTLRMQALLLRFLESGEVQPVGGDATQVRVDARVITATNRDLRKLAAEGLFREDLMYRIRVVQVHVPPLRERPEDIRPLLKHFMHKLNPAPELTAAVWEALEAYHWPGNVREVQNVVEQLGAVARSGPIDLADLPWCPPTAAGQPPRDTRDQRRCVADDLFDRLTTGRSTFWAAVYERFINRDLTRQDVRDLIARGLAAGGGSYGELLRLFGMAPEEYKRLLNFLARYGCTVDYRSYRARTRHKRAAATAQSDEPADGPGTPGVADCSAWPACANGDATDVAPWRA
jgi:transcriptional regulator with GAF, ATPase, and Fis domain